MGCLTWLVMWPFWVLVGFIRGLFGKHNDF